MILCITETCLDENYEVGYRTYDYIVPVDTAEEAINLFLNEFDVDYVCNCNDSFDGECISSTISKIEIEAY